MGYFLSMTLRLSGRVMVAVMRKQGQAHAGAQGFHACHKAQEARDFVFSDPRR